MKILLIHTSFTPNFHSGVNPIFFGSYETLKKTGHEVFVFASDEKPYYDENYQYSNFFPASYRYYLNDNKLITKLKYFRNSLYNFEAEKKLGLLLDEIKPDIVHIHTICELSPSIIKAVKQRHIPLVYTVHDISLFCPAVFGAGTNLCCSCRGYNTIPCLLKKCMKGSAAKSMYSALKGFIERAIGVYNDIDLFITVSPAVRDYVKNMGIPENKLRLLYNFADKKLIESTKNLDFSQASDYFLYAGGAYEHKGIYTLLKAVSILPKEIKFHIAGSGDYTQAEKYIKENKLHNIKILGMLSSEELQNEYKKCTAVIIPSECFETFGMIAAEAAVFSKPSIASDTGGLSDTVDDGRTGLLFEPENTNQLKECILKYWNNKNTAAEHGKNAALKALDEYSEDLYYKKLIEIYEDAVKRFSAHNDN